MVLNLVKDEYCVLQEWRGTVPLSCEMCGKLFNGRNRRQNLQHHMMIHLGVKPFLCPICPHRSNRKGNLDLHILRVHGKDDTIGTVSSSGAGVNSQRSPIISFALNSSDTRNDSEDINAIENLYKDNLSEKNYLKNNG